MKPTRSSERCAQLLRVVADPDRLQILRALRERAQNVTDLAALLDKDIGNVSHHLKVLRMQGFVRTRRDGKHIIYSLAEAFFQATGDTSAALDLGCCRLELRR